ncbi:MAG TPA: hypothetical protein VFG78_10255 [Gemmatimonadota bacterium]|nr:hypothetical protein [Gemmatimonadota bacterium]
MTMRNGTMTLVVAGLAWLGAAGPALAQNPTPGIRKPAPIITIPKAVPKVDPDDAAAAPSTPVARDPAGGALEASVDLSPTVTESGPDVTCSITASRDPYEAVPISNNGETAFGPSDAHRVWFHTRRQNLGASSFPTAQAKTQILVDDVVVEEVPGLFNMEGKDCTDCLPVQKSKHQVDLPPFFSVIQVVGTMENDIHNVVAESNESNNRCTIEFTAKAQSQFPPFESEVY